MIKYRFITVVSGGDVSNLSKFKTLVFITVLFIWANT